MTEILSPSPWSGRQEAVRQNPPISYAWLQAENAGLIEEMDRMQEVSDTHFSHAEQMNAKSETYRAMCEELCKALDGLTHVLKGNYSNQNGSMAIHGGAHNYDMRFQWQLADFRDAYATLTKARKLLEGKE